MTSIGANDLYCVNTNQQYGIDFEDGIMYVKKLNVTDTTWSFGDTIFQVDGYDDGVIQDNLIVAHKYVDSTYVATFYNIDSNMDTVSQIQELINPCQVMKTCKGVHYFNNSTYYYILISSVENIISMTYNNKTYIDTSDATATAGDIILDKTAYVNGEKITGIYKSGMSQSDYDECLELSEQILGENVSL